MERKVVKAILPAAGLGTRFLPATKASPKEMLPIVDKPLIQYAVEEAESCGIDEFIIITGKHKRPIEDHFDVAFELEETLRRNGKEALLSQINIFGHVDFAFIRQGVAMGLGHAVYCAHNFVGDEPFAVLLSDDVIPPGETLLRDMLGLFEELGAPVVALMRVPREEISKYGVIGGEDRKPGVFRIKDLVEKPSPEDAPSELAVIGRYILTPDIFEVLGSLPPGRGGEIQLTDAIKVLAERRPVYGMVFEGKRYDAGSKLGFLKATVDFALQDEELSGEFGKYIQEAASRIKG
ncbi:MAG: UTP--glucose-1-phosphate uridylyltransferase GalU [Nitrospirota bacterium]|jgi:UTP--glucose-1-phosphate uridylyltransferase